jgi:hypothetical protein
MVQSKGISLPVRHDPIYSKPPAYYEIRQDIFLAISYHAGMLNKRLSIGCKLSCFASKRTIAEACWILILPAEDALIKD